MAKGFNTRIKCVETGVIYPSIKYCADNELYVSPRTLGRHVNEGTKCQGFTFEIVPGEKKQSCKRKIKNVDTGAVYGSQREAARSEGISESSISNVIHGTAMTAGGYRWERICE